MNKGNSINSQDSQTNKDEAEDLLAQEKSNSLLLEVLQKLGRFGLGVCMLTLLLLAFYVTLGRQLMPYVDWQKERVEGILVDALGVDVVIGAMLGDWMEFSPVIILENIEIPYETTSSTEQFNIHTIGRLELEFDIPASLLQRKVIIAGISINNLNLNLVETSSGSWLLDGFNTSGSGYTEQIIDFFLSTNRFDVNQTNLIFHQENGNRLEINNLDAQLSNFIGQHQLQANFSLFDQTELNSFQFELLGDPRNGINGNGFLNLNQVDMSQLVSLNSQNELALSKLSGSGSFWFELENNSLLEFHGNLFDSTIHSDLGDNFIPIELNNASTEVTVLKHNQNRWQIWLENVQFDLYERSWQGEDFFAELDLSNERALLEISTEKINLGVLYGMLGEISLNDSIKNVITDLHPSGELSNINFSTDLLGNYPDGFELHANLVNISVGAWSSAPSMSGINGYLQANQNGGFVELDSRNFDIHLPNIFSENWHYNDINTRVNWKITDRLVSVNSSVIDVSNESIHGRVQFEVRNYRNEQNVWETDLSLLVGVLDFDAAKKSSYLPNLDNIEDIMSWLDQGLMSGHVSNSGFLFHGRMSGNVIPNSSTMKTFYTIEEADLNFLPEWPVLESLTGYVEVNNNNVDIQLSKASLAGINLDPTIITVRPNESSQGAWLSIQGGAQTNANLGLDFIRNSPVRDTMGEYMDNWNASGEIELLVELGIPINNVELENKVDIIVNSNLATLDIPDFNLNISEIIGQISYSNSSGLNAENLDAIIWNESVIVNIESYNNMIPDSMFTDEGTIITGIGRVSSESLLNSEGVSEFVKDILRFSEGDLPYQAQFRVNNSENIDGLLSTLSIRSDLIGLEFSLPAPFYKNKNESQLLSLDIDFFENSQILTGRYAEDFYSQIQFSNDNVDRGLIYFGMLNQDFGVRQSNSSEAGILISGNLDYFNYDEWEQVSLSFRDGDQDADVADTIRFVDVNIFSLEVLGETFDEINTQISYVGNSWNVFVENELVRGVFEFPDDSETPIEINLDYLSFDDDSDSIEESVTTTIINSQTDEEIEDYFFDIDPSTLPNLNFKTDSFSIGARDLGAWEFDLRRNSIGVNLADFKIVMDGANLFNLSGEGGAEVEWTYINGNHLTQFDGIFEIGDMSDVLPKFGYGEVLESDSARFVSSLQWQGSPAAFSMTTTSGSMNVRISDGRFVTIDPGGARLFGALNFDSIVRRLQLDFSDLYETGLAYDEISGQLLFTNGVVHSNGVFVIDGPSSIINIEGEIDLANQTVNTDLLVSIPISQNIAVVAGIIGVWPVAIGTYIAGKIFRDQFAGLAAVRYHLEGPWDELSTGFEPATSEDIIEVIDE